MVEKYQELYMVTQVLLFLVVGGINSPSKRSVRVKLYQALVIA